MIEPQTPEEENIKLKYLLKAAMAEIKKRESDLKPLNFRIGELESYIDELEYEKKNLSESELIKKVNMYENGNIKTPNEINLKQKVKNIQLSYEKADIKCSFFRRRLFRFLTEEGINQTIEELTEKLKESGL